MSQKINWLFITLRPRDGIESIGDDKIKIIIEWFKKHSSSLFVVKEKEGTASHLHICCCWNQPTTRTNFQSLYRKSILISVLGLKTDELRCNNNIGAIKILDKKEVIDNYLSGNYNNGTKDKSKDCFNILYNYINDEDYNKFVEVIPTNYKNKRNNMLDIIYENLPENFIPTFVNINALFIKLHIDNILPIFYNKYLEEKYMVLLYHRYTGCKHDKVIQNINELIKFNDDIERHCNMNI